LGEFAAKHSLKGSAVIVGVPGRNSQARFVALPPVEAKKIPQIVEFEAKQQIPHLGWSQGVHRISQQRPHLQHGLGVHRVTSTDIYDYFDTLARRLRNVRVCCGDWSRVMGYSPTEAVGLTGVFLDPPYRAYEKLYGTGDSHVADAVAEWAREHADLRVALCGHRGDYDLPGWDAVSWDRGRLTYAGGKTTADECIWYSPACEAATRAQVEMFGGVA